jgi:hypothetical protein
MEKTTKHKMVGIKGKFDRYATIHAHANQITEITKKALKSKVHIEEIELVKHIQAHIEHISRGGNNDMEIQTWVNVCPSCDRVTEIRAIPSTHFKFGYHGPNAESVRCTDCAEAK